MEVPQSVPFPKKTSDYRIKSSSYGLGLYANRNIPKGDRIFDDSTEFLFSDVEDGDSLLFDSTVTASKQCGEGKVPTRFPLSRDVLMRTHGVPKLYPDSTNQFSGIVSWNLEVPVMLMNHSCDPNTSPTSTCTATGEDIATKDIKRGEELTSNYNLQFFDYGPFFDQCTCGSSNCLGQMNGFKSLSDEEKEKILPMVSKAVEAMHRAELGDGLPVKHEQIPLPPRLPCQDTGKIPRHVFPGPSHALAEVAVRRQDNDSDKFGLYAMKDFKFGEEVYSFYCQDWYFGGKVSIDMVFASLQLEGDPAEGTVIRLNPLECASQNRDGTWICSGWDSLTTHSCEPNLIYRHTQSEEDEDWRCTFAAKEIKKGDRLTVDVNCNIWDRSDCKAVDKCNCGATTCTGTMKGFKFLTNKAQEERKIMSWRRESPPYSGQEKLGMALSLRIRDQLGLVSSSNSSSSSSSSSDSD